MFTRFKKAFLHSVVKAHPEFQGTWDRSPRGSDQYDFRALCAIEVADRM